MMKILKSEEKLLITGNFEKIYKTITFVYHQAVKYFHYDSDET